MKKPMDEENLHSVDVITPLFQEYLEKEFLARFEDATEHNIIEAEVAIRRIMDFCQAKGSSGSSRPTQLASVERAPGQESQSTDEADKNPLPQERSTAELKKLPSGLKYAYLGEKETKPVIINSQLTQKQEEKLMKVLERNQKAIGLKLSDLVGISPDLCMHHIRLEEGAKAHRDPQRKLNPHMREEVLKEGTFGVLASPYLQSNSCPCHTQPKHLPHPGGVLKKKCGDEIQGWHPSPHSLPPSQKYLALPFSSG
ncbi:hypothetical protein AAHA92_25028 [Salvia divinorum]|uniref:Uncharacterized protein n=1 Tax=Salvia divinorum TaxID=28513 RepID=A0ABD1GCE9_SALDI